MKRFNQITKKIISMAKKEAVLTIAIIAMIISMFFVPPDYKYLGYINVKTICALYATLSVVMAFKNIEVFEAISRSLILRLGTLRNVVIAIVTITFLGSMVLANDMALITFLPLGAMVLISTGNTNIMAFVFIMQNIAANLGGMLTPFGNPQNMYLFSKYKLTNDEFMKIMLPTFIAAILLIYVICFFAVKNEKLEIKKKTMEKVDLKRTIVYAALFILSISILFGKIMPVLAALIVTLALLLLDKKAIKDVNYPLLLTFIAFFVFSGNMARIKAVGDFIGHVMKGRTLLVGILSCQFISNVPSSILLSKFTSDYQNLIPAVNIGGCGTLIASLASLITYSRYKELHESPSTKKYLLKFTKLNVLFILVLVAVQLVVNEV